MLSGCSHSLRRTRKMKASISVASSLPAASCSARENTDRLGTSGEMVASASTMAAENAAATTASSLHATIPVLRTAKLQLCSKTRRRIRDCGSDHNPGAQSVDIMEECAPGSWGLWARSSAGGLHQHSA